jgi:hypothetical protein
VICDFALSKIRRPNPKKEVLDFNVVDRYFVPLENEA